MCAKNDRTTGEKTNKTSKPTLEWLLLTILIATLATACSRSPREVKPPKEKIFRFALVAKIPSLDPHVTNDVYSSLAQSLVYDSLYEFHYLKRPRSLVPALAQSLPTWSKDRKTLTIKLKKGIYFQDDPCFEATGGKGREVTGKDFIYSIERIAAPKFFSPAYSGFEDQVVGINDYHAGKTKTISGLKLINNYTVEIRLSKVLPRFVYNFTGSSTAIVARECVEKYGQEFSQHPVGTGPYKIVQFDGAKVVAVKNPHYKVVSYPSEGMPGDKEKGLLADTGKQLPLIDKIILETVVEDQPTWLKFLVGETEMSRVPRDNTESAVVDGKLSEDLAKRGVQLAREPQSDVTVQIFNLNDSVWGRKKELRQAFALAVDVNKVMKLRYANQAIRAHSLLDPTMYGYNPQFKSRWTERNVSKAKELLKKAGYPDGQGLPPIIITTTMSTSIRQLHEVIERSVAEANIVVKSDPVTWPELSKKVHEHRYMMVGMGYAGNFPDADGALALLHSRNIKSGVNVSAYKNVQLDQLIDEIEAMENSPQRLAKIQKAIEIIDEDLPMVTFVHRIGNQLVQPWVKSHVFLDELFIGPSLKYLKVGP